MLRTDLTATMHRAALLRWVDELDAAHGEVTAEEAGPWKAVSTSSTDERLAKLVGGILHSTNSASDRLGDAHVVAVCAGADAALVVTSDPNDIVELDSAVPGTRVLARRPIDLRPTG